MNPLHTGCCSFGRGSAVAGRLVTVVLAGLGLVASTATADPLWWDEIGGDDVPAVMADVYELASPVMDIAESGEIYIAAPTGTAGSTSLVVFRSTDGGDTWPEWGRLDSLGVTYSDVSIRVAEGIVSRLYLAYTIEAAAGGRQEIHVAWSPLGGASASWSYRVVLTGAAEVFSGPCLDSDEANINGFRLYLAAEGDDGNGHDIWFTRSLNYGDSWETPYEIASLATGDHYRGPSVAYGWGGVVHAAWTYDPVASTTRDSAVRYRRAMNYAGNGIADWQATVYLTSNTNGITEGSPIVAPSLGGNDVLLSCSYNAGGPDWGVSLYRSEDVGATWPATPGADEMAYHMEPLSLPGTAGFTFRSDAGVVHPGLQSSTGAAPLALSQFKNVADRWCDPTHYFSVHDRQDYNMARGNRRGVIWMSEGVAAPDTIWFDAEWRTDPGYPNVEPRFPLALINGIVSPPGICELDGDPESEIVCGDDEGRLLVFNHDGSPLPGWPIDIGDFASDGTIAVGSITGNSDNEVVAGNSTGQVYAWTAGGAPLPGWPKDLATNAPAYVAISAISTPQRQVVAVSGTKVFLVNGDGTTVPGFPASTATSITAAPAIGDLDNDGDREIVIVQQGYMDAFRGNGTVQSFRSLVSAGQTMSNAPTLADLNLDGDLEIMVPTNEGRLYVLNPDGTDYPGGWPWISPSGRRISSVALANIRAGHEPELVFNVETSSPAEVHAFYQNMTELSGFPHTTIPGWSLFAAPIVDVLDEGSSDVVIGSRDTWGYAWTNFGVELPGWPEDLDAQNNVSPASGDIDGDGHLEVVYTTHDPALLIVVDVGADVFRSPTEATWWWPMYGYNPLRQGCLACDNDQVSDVVDGAPPAGRFRLAAPSPNPATGPVTLAFELPEAAAVRLELFDAQGRLVRRLLKEEMAAGPHTATWNPASGEGGAVPGIYFLRLRMSGGSGTNVATRKVVVQN